MVKNYNTIPVECVLLVSDDTDWVVAAAVVCQSYAALNRRTLAVIGFELSHTNSMFSLGLDIKRIKYKCCLTGTTCSWVTSVDT